MDIKLENNGVYIELKKRESSYISRIDSLYSIVENILPKMNNIFDNYTEHGLKHSLRVLRYMSELIQDVGELSELELVMIIYAALLHDIGMVVSDEEKEKIINNGENDLGMKYKAIYKKYENEKKALQEYIRPVHGMRVKKLIEKSIKKEHFIVENTDIYFLKEIEKICQSHNESGRWIKSNLESNTIKGESTINTQYIAVLLRLGDILDYDSDRTPMYIYSLFKLDSRGDTEWKKHFDIDNSKKIIVNKHTNEKSVALHGVSSDEEVHRKILEYINWIDDELAFSVDLCDTFFDEKYRLMLKDKVQNNIKTEGFTISNFKLSLDYKAVTSLLMGDKIYGDLKYGLREIIQNSIDACKLMKEIKEKTISYRSSDYKPQIKIIFNQESEEVIITDNGTGMTLEMLQKYFLSAGVSYYRSDEFKFKNYEYAPIGNYGIGFLACFMLSEKVKIETKHYEMDTTNEIKIKKNSEYIVIGEKKDADSSGTSIFLNYKSFMEAFEDKIENVKAFVEENFLLEDISIKLIGEFDNTICEKESIIWNNNINQYLEGIKVRMSKEPYLKVIKTFDVLSREYESNVIFYNEDDNEFITLENSSKVPSFDKYVSDDKIEHVKISMYSEDMKEIIHQVGDEIDIKELFERYKNAISEHINLFSTEFIDFHDGEKVWVDDLDILLSGNAKLSDFISEIQLFYVYACEYGTEVEYVSQRVVLCKEKNSLLKVDEKIKLDHGNSDEYEKVAIYNKNVLLKEAQIVIPYMCAQMNMDKMIINFNHEAIIPNISRNNIASKDIQDKIGYAIGKSLHMYILENKTSNLEEKELLRLFIDKYYGEDNIFLKNIK